MEIETKLDETTCHQQFAARILLSFLCFARTSSTHPVKLIRVDNDASRCTAKFLICVYPNGKTDYRQAIL